MLMKVFGARKTIDRDIDVYITYE